MAYSRQQCLHLSVRMELMKTSLFLILVLLFIPCLFGQDELSCPPTATNNGPEAQYTEDAAKAGIKGRMTLSATIDLNGCATDIKVLTPLGHGLDESSVSALQRWRFRKPSKPFPVNIEFNFDPNSSSRDAVTGATCEELCARNSDKK